MEKDLESLDVLLDKLDGEIRIVMEAAGIYQLPVLIFFMKKKISRPLSIRIQ